MCHWPESTTTALQEQKAQNKYNSKSERTTSMNNPKKSNKISFKNTDLLFSQCLNSSNSNYGQVCHTKYAILNKNNKINSMCTVMY